MKVVVDGKSCPVEKFVSDNATEYPELGCRIQIRSFDSHNLWITPWEHHLFNGNALVNFHGQLVTFCYPYICGFGLYCLSGYDRCTNGHSIDAARSDSAAQE